MTANTQESVQRDHIQKQNLEITSQILARALEQDGQNTDTLFNLATALLTTGEMKKAEKICQKLLPLRVETLEPLIGIATSMYRLGGQQAASVLTKQMLQEVPHVANVYFRLSELCWSLGMLEEAAQLLRQNVLLEPDNCDAISNLGGVLLEMGQHELAEKILLKAVAITPDHTDALCNLASIMGVADHFDGAIKLLQTVLEIDPKHATARDSLGFIQWQSGNYVEAENQFRKAILHAPNHENAHANLGMVLLTQGKFAEGWKEYRFRTKLIRNQNSQRNYKQVLWQGEDICEQTLLVYPEQGLGDIIQFVRYAFLLEPRVKRLVIEVPKSLNRLLSGFNEHALLVSPEESFQGFDTHISLLSLPGALGSDEQTIPDFTPYITAETEKIALWKDRLPKDGEITVGLAWQGNSKNTMDHKRSIPLDLFQNVLELGEINFVSLQKGEGEESIRKLGDRQNLISFADELDAGPDAFIDSAAIIANLDLVITCDSAIAHLAGAMGKPVWILLSHVADFRWMADRDDTPWYSSARLFRQTGSGDWGSVMEQVRQALGSLLESR